MFAQQMQQMHIDLEKMPLGSISETQVRSGYAALTRIADQLKTPASDPGEQAARLYGLTSSFYTTIPHRFELRETPPVIDTMTMLKEKLDMIESLLQISQSQRLS